MSDQFDYEQWREPLYDLLPDPPFFRNHKVNGIGGGKTGIERSQRIAAVKVGDTLSVSMSVDNHGQPRYGLFSNNDDVGYLPYEISEIVSRAVESGIEVSRAVKVKVSSVTPVFKRKKGAKYALLSVDVDFSDDVVKLAEEERANTSNELGFGDLDFSDLSNMSFSISIDGEEIYNSSADNDDYNDFDDYWPTDPDDENFEKFYSKSINAGVGIFRTYLSNPDESKIKDWIIRTKHITLQRDDSILVFSDGYEEFNEIFSPDTIEWVEMAEKLGMDHGIVNPVAFSQPISTNESSMPDEDLTQVYGVSKEGEFISVSERVKIFIPYGVFYLQDDSGLNLTEPKEPLSNYCAGKFSIYKTPDINWSILIQSDSASETHYATAKDWIEVQKMNIKLAEEDEFAPRHSVEFMSDNMYIITTGTDNDDGMDSNSIFFNPPKFNMYFYSKKTIYNLSGTFTIGKRSGAMTDTLLNVLTSAKPLK